MGGGISRRLEEKLEPGNPFLVGLYFESPFIYLALCVIRNFGWNLFGMPPSLVIYKGVVSSSMVILPSQEYSPWDGLRRRIEFLHLAKPRLQ